MVDLQATHIFDAADVVCSILTVAASVGGTCLLASGIVCDRPLPRVRRRLHGHHHGPDGGHFGPAAQTGEAHMHRHDHDHGQVHDHADDEHGSVVV